MVIWLGTIIIFSLLNLALGVLAAAFFGFGPLRDAWFVYALSYPCIPPPRWLARWLERLVQGRLVKTALLVTRTPAPPSSAPPEPSSEAITG